MPQVAAGEAVGHQAESEEGAQQRLHGAVREAQCAGALAIDGNRLIDSAKRFRTDRAILVDPLRLQQPTIGLETGCAQGRKVVQSLGDSDVARIVDGRLRPQCSSALEVLLDAGAFVVEVQRRDHAVGEYT